VIGDKIIIRIVFRENANNDRNVYALDYDGNILWQVERCPHGGERPKSYRSIYRVGSTELAAGNWIGYDYYIDLNDGSVEVKAFTK